MDSRENMRIEDAYKEEDPVLGTDNREKLGVGVDARDRRRKILVGTTGRNQAPGLQMADTN